MATGFKSGGRDWQPGESGNPEGRKPLPLALKKLRKIRASELQLIISKVSRMDPMELIEWCKKPMREGGPNMIEAAVASIYSKSVRSGDHTALSFLMDRCVGKVVENKTVQVQPVTYKTSIRADGSLMQEVLEAEVLGDKDEE